MPAARGGAIGNCDNETYPFPDIRMAMESAPADAARTSGTAIFTFDAFKRGLREGIPFAPGIFAFGIVFGVLAMEAGLTPWGATVMSTVVYAGTAQLLSLQSWHGAGLTTVVAAVFAMNARYVLFGAAVRPWMRGLPAWIAYPSLFLLVDLNWMEAMREQKEGRHDVGHFVGVGLTLMIVWVIATIVGVVVGSGIDPRAFGFDFFLTAFFLILATSMWRGPADILPAAISGIVAVVLQKIGWGNSSIFLGALAGSLFAAATYGRRRPA